MTNKTPIQELIDWFEQNGTRFTTEFKDEYLQKEKAFAFDCFEAGRSYQNGEVRYSLTKLNHDIPCFDEFYSQYAEQHTN